MRPTDFKALTVALAIAAATLLMSGHYTELTVFPGFTAHPKFVAQAYYLAQMWCWAFAIAAAFAVLMTIRVFVGLQWCIRHKRLMWVA
jgi:membrane protein insertase Oxa1/YidC/SpoIIIJ